MTDEHALSVADVRERGRWELRLGERTIGFATYREEPGVVTVDYVEVEPAFGGRGFGSRLVEHALSDIRARGLSVVPACPFAAWYVREHPEHADLVRGASADA